MINPQPSETSTKKTKILATLGPASFTEENLIKMFDNGADLIRINASHIRDPKEVMSVIKLVRDSAHKAEKHIGILLDLQGPKIRLGKFENKEAKLEDGQTFTIHGSEISGNEKEASVTYENFVKDVQVGEMIYIDDGRVQLNITDKTSDKIICEVIKGGVISNHKGINLPDTTITSDPLTEKDRQDTLVAIEGNVDYVALSFVSFAADVKLLRDFIDDNGGKDIKIIAKIERQHAIDNIISIIDESDAIMVARGDLGVEIGVENVPRVQKRLIRETNRRLKPVIVATQMLESMIQSRNATRAEVSDVANAIYDGCDTVMLSGETAVGVDPVNVIETMSSICLASDTHLEELKADMPKQAQMVEPSTAVSFCKAADQISQEINADAIVAFTSSGNTPLIASKLNPSIPILSATDCEEMCRRINLYRGVTPILLPKPFSEIHRWRDMIGLAVDIAKEKGYIKTGDILIVIAGIPIGVPNGINSIRYVTVN